MAKSKPKWDHDFVDEEGQGYVEFDPETAVRFNSTIFTVTWTAN